MVSGPGLQEGEKAQLFDEAIASQSAELDLEGGIHAVGSVSGSISVFLTFNLEQELLAVRVMLTTAPMTY